MSLLTRASTSRRDLLVGGAASVIVLALAVAAPSEVGKLLASVAVAALVAIFVLTDPVMAILLVYASSFLRQAQKGIVPTEVLTPAMIMLVLAYVLAVARGDKRRIQLGVVEWLMAAYLAWNVLSWMLPHQYEAIDPMTGDSQDIYRWIFTGTIVPFFAYVMAKGVLDTERAVRMTLWATVIFSAYSAWVSILQFHGPKSLVWPKYIVNAPNWVGRANGLANQPVVNGLILDMGFLACLYLASRPGTRGRIQVLLYAIAAASAYSVYLTHTRVALLCLLIAIGIGILFATGWRRAFVVTALLGVAAVAANYATIFSGDRSQGGVGSSTEVFDRLNIMATGFQAIQEHPFVGIGIARFLIYNTYNHQQWSNEVAWRNGYNLISHENEVGIAAELGIPGLLMWLGVLVTIGYLLWRAFRELPKDRFFGQPLALVGIIGMITLVVNGLTVDLRLLDFATFVPFLFAGIVVGALERHRREHAPPRPGLPGSGLPGGMTPDEQREWWDTHPRPEDERPAGREGDVGPGRRLEPAR